MKKILKKEFFTSLIENYGKQHTYINLSNVKQQLQNMEIDNTTAIDIYHTFASANHGKVGQVFNLVQKQIAKKEHRYPQREQLPYLVAKMAAYIQFSIPIQNQFKKLKEKVLFGQLGNSEYSMLLMLFKKKRQKMLKGNSDKLLQFLRQSVQQCILSPKLKLNPSQLLDIYEIENSQGLLTEQIQQYLYKRVNNQLELFNSEQIKRLKRIGKKRSLEEWNKIALYQTSQIKIRIIHQIMLHQFNMNEFNLLGKSWETEPELAETIDFIISQGKTVPFIDLIQNKIPPSSQTFLLLSHFIKYFFHFVSNGYWKLGSQQMSNFIIFVEERVILNDQCMKKLEFLILFKLLIILDYFSRFTISDASKNSPHTELKRLESYIFERGFQDISFEEISQRQIKTLTGYLLIHLGEDYKKEEKNSKSFNYKRIFEKLIKYYGAQSFLLQAQGLVSFCQFLNKQKLNSINTYSSILYSQQVGQVQLFHIFKDSIQEGKLYDKEVEQTWKYFQDNFTLIKNVILQPNLHFQFALVEKQSKKINAAFNLAKKQQQNIFSGELLQKEGQFITKERDLNYSGLWKSNIFSSIYNSQYFYCLNEEEFNKKLWKFIIKRFIQ